MSKELCYKIEAKLMPTVKKVGKGGAVRYTAVYEEPPGVRWFNAFVDIENEVFVAQMLLLGCREITP